MCRTAVLYTHYCEQLRREVHSLGRTDAYNWRGLPLVNRISGTEALRGVAFRMDATCHRNTADFGNEQSAYLGRFRLGSVSSTVPESPLSGGQPRHAYSQRTSRMGGTGRHATHEIGHGAQRGARQGGRGAGCRPAQGQSIITVRSTRAPLARFPTARSQRSSCSKHQRRAHASTEVRFCIHLWLKAKHDRQQQHVPVLFFLLRS